MQSRLSRGSQLSFVFLYHQGCRMKLLNTAVGIVAARALGRPFYVRFHVTHRCNYRCRMCALRDLADESREVDLGQVHVIAGRLRALGARHAVVTGGEPFLRRDLPAVVAAFADRGFSVRVQTNGGRQVTAERIEACRDAGLCDLSVSIDTLDAALQDSICGVDGALDNALRTLDLAHRLLPRGMSLANIVASRYNFEQLPELVRRIFAMGAYSYITPVMVAAGSDGPEGHYLFRGEDAAFGLVDIAQPVRDRVLDELVEIRSQGGGLTNSIRFLEDFRRYLETGSCSWKCEAGTLCLDVHPDGAMCVCKEKPPVANVLDDDFVAFYRSSTFRELAQQVSASCTGCFYGEYREPQYAVRDLATFSEWVLRWLRTYRHGMRRPTVEVGGPKEQGRTMADAPREGHEVREDGTGRPIRLCFFAHLSDLGGAERTLLELVEQLIDDHGADCTVVAPGSGPLILRLEEAGARVVRTEYWWWCTAEELSCEEMQRRVGLGLANLVLEIMPELRRVNPDVICTETIVIPYGALAARWLRKPHIWSIREYGEAGGFRFMMPWARIAAFMRDHSDFMFGVNRRICEELVPGIQPGDHDVLYPAIVAPASIKNLDRPPGGRTFRVCEFATIDRGRRLDIAILAVAELARRGREVRLTIAGRQHDGYAAELERLAQDLGIGGLVEVRGFVSDVFAAMVEHDALVISAPVHGLGRTAIEGMVCGIPVVYPLGTGFDDSLDDGVTGLGYAAGDALAMADRVDALIRDPGLRIALGRRARLKAQATFSKDGFSGKFLRKAVELAGRPRLTKADACTDLLEAMALAVGDLERHAANLERIVSARDDEIRSLSRRHSTENRGAEGGRND